jgi:predicted nucleic acid-binding protein
MSKVLLDTATLSEILKGKSAGELVESSVCPDVFIAAIALQNGVPIVTGNVAHFVRVSSAGHDLLIGNWKTT